MNHIDEKELKKITESVLKVVTSSSSLSLEEACQYIKRGEKKATSMHLFVVITMVDLGGNIIALHRMDNSLLASIQISYSKAYTAASFKRATSELAQEVLPGNSLYGMPKNPSPDYCFFAGGIPIFKNGFLVGAIGVSGGTIEQDQTIAKAALLE